MHIGEEGVIKNGCEGEENIFRRADFINVNIYFIFLCDC